ncbi:MAG TPA: hypothetical protein VNC60_09015 [Actinomycetota bacterium]|nr:hypothetical protein [Actinomycetota bacterium]
MDLWWLVCLFAAAGALAGFRVMRGRDRARQIMLACHRAGLEFSPIDPFPDTLWLPFRWLGEGRWSRAENVVWSRAEGDDVRAFDLSIEQVPAGDGAPRVVHRYTCAVVALPLGCPRLEITPHEGVRELLDAADVELELEGFNRRFRVRSDDRRFAVAFCDQRMMRALMGLPPGVTIAVNEDRLLLRAASLPATEVLLLFEAARAIGRSVPPVVATLYPPRPSVGRFEQRWLQGRWSPEPTGDDAVGSSARPGRA